MRRMWMSALAICLAISAPVRADDEPKLVEPPKDAKAEQATPIKKLKEVRLDQFLVPARALNIPFSGGRMQTVQDLLDSMNKWSADDEIGGILFNLDGLALQLPDVEELRSGVAKLRSSGKKVFAFLNAGDPMSYLLACGMDEISMAPTGSLSIPGMGNVYPFMRGMYQMQGIEYEVITAGAFKYPGYVNRREPPENFKIEFGQLFDSWYGDYVRFIADGRQLPTDRVQKAIDTALFNAEAAKQNGLIDTINYYDEYLDRLLRREKFKKAAEGESGLSKVTSLQDLLTTISREMQDAQEKYKEVGPKIAVLHARGPIVDVSMGSGFSSSMIMRDDFVKTVEEIRKNKSIRAVVLRIDSPGGSGYASDIIWRALKQLDEEKPLVISQGTVAASGGYYMSCAGRLVFAQPTTVTGSIGVIAMLANQASALNRMDVNMAEIKRGERALLGAAHRDMSPEDREFLQQYILDFYETFLDRVAAGRKIPKDEVRKIAGGRVYTGRQAIEVGLVDRLGGLNDAVAAVREIAGIPASAEIKLVHYPRPSTLGDLAESFLGVTAATQVLTQSQTAAPVFTFDSQLKFFAQSPRPLCWMAMPEIGAGVSQPSPFAAPAFDLMAEIHKAQQSAFAPMQLP